MQAAKHERLIMRLIDADALLEAVRQYEIKSKTYYVILDMIINAPTIQREGWVSVPRKLPYDEMRQVIVDYFDELKDGRRVLIEEFWNELLSAAPTDTE